MASRPYCELCDEDAAQHTITINGDTFQVCTGCFLENEGGE